MPRMFPRCHYHYHNDYHYYYVPEVSDEEIKLMSSEDWAEMVAGVVTRTGVDMGADLVDLVWNICR